MRAEESGPNAFAHVEEVAGLGEPLWHGRPAVADAKRGKFIFAELLCLIHEQECAFRAVGDSLHIAPVFSGLHANPRLVWKGVLQRTRLVEVLYVGKFELDLFDVVLDHILPNAPQDVNHDSFVLKGELDRDAAEAPALCRASGASHPPYGRNAIACRLHRTFQLRLLGLEFDPEGVERDFTYCFIGHWSLIPSDFFPALENGLVLKPHLRPG